MKVVVTMLVRPAINMVILWHQLDLTHAGGGVTPAVTVVVVGPGGPWISESQKMEASLLFRVAWRARSTLSALQPALGSSDESMPGTAATPPAKAMMAEKVRRSTCMAADALCASFSSNLMEEVRLAN